MLEIIVAGIGIATVLNLFLKKFHIPTIIGFIATGTIITYGFELHDATNSHDLKLVAEFGIVFLMFTIGLEFSVKHLIRMKKEVFMYGGLQVIITATLITLIAIYGFDLDIKAAVIIGAALALSSTAIVLKLLNENGDINQQYGQRSLGILLFQDITVIPILLMITMFSAEDIPVHTLLLKTVIAALVLFVALWFTGKYLLEPFLHEVTKVNSNEIFIGSILFLVLGASSMAHLIGFSYSLGAFLAGMLIAETRYKHQIEADLIPFRDLLLGVFFVTVGMQINFTIISDYLLMILLLLVGLIALKVIIIFMLLQFATSKRVALKSALSLFQLGEFGLVVFELASTKNLLDTTTTQVLIVVIILSMILTPFLLRHISSVTDFLMPSAKGETLDLAHISKGYSNHIILIGYGRLGKHIAKLLERDGYDYVVIEQNIKTAEDAQKQGKPVIFGNAAQKHILEALNIHKSLSVVISLGNNEKLYLVCQTVQKVAPNVKTVVKVNSFQEKQMLLDLGLTHIIVETEETAIGMYNEALKT